MAKRKVIWSNTAMKKLYTIFESDIRKGNGKSFSVDLFNKISKQVSHLKRNPEFGMRTSDDSISGLITESFTIYYEIKNDKICIHFMRETGPGQ